MTSRLGMSLIVIVPASPTVTDWKLYAELLTYSRSKGLFSGIDLTGDKVSQNTDDTTTLYKGNNSSYQEILKGGVAAPARRASVT
jgi:lipid-binding SYLF domain-containing protein